VAGTIFGDSKGNTFHREDNKGQANIKALTVILFVPHF
jgi:hypothetical protein